VYLAPHLDESDGVPALFERVNFLLLLIRVWHYKRRAQDSKGSAAAVDFGWRSLSNRSQQVDGKGVLHQERMFRCFRSIQYT
jgi:hypothetical protein